MTADPVQRLLDIEEIKQLMSRYCRNLDLQDWDKLALTFAEDVVFDTATGVNITGRAAMIELLRSVLASANTVHHALLPDIEVNGDTAQAVWVINDMVDKTKTGGSLKRGYSHCHQDCVRVDGVWRIKRFALTFLRIDQNAQP